MKRKKTIVRPDGSKEIIEEDDQAPVHHKHDLDAQKKGEPPAKQYLDRMASKGHGGDTKLAHVNQWEEALLKKLGGAGTKNPHTGLRQYFTIPGQPDDTGQVAPVQGTAINGSSPDMFNIPTDIKPFSVSGSQSQSGLPNQYRDQLLASLMPQLQQSITDMPGNWDKYTNEALGSYQQMMNNALRTNIPKALAGLSNRGILNSTEGQGVLGNVYSQAAMDAANKGYGTAMQAALGKANMPTVLGQIAQLGQGTQSNQFSYAEDPTTMYRDLSATIRAMMG